LCVCVCGRMCVYAVLCRIPCEVFNGKLVVSGGEEDGRCER
jgi:hypothetical protein